LSQKKIHSKEKDKGTRWNRRNSYGWRNMATPQVQGRRRKNGNSKGSPPQRKQIRLGRHSLGVRWTKPRKEIAAGMRQ